VIVRTRGLGAEGTDRNFRIRAWYRNTTGSVVLYDSTSGASDIAPVSSCDLSSNADMDTLTITYNTSGGAVDRTGTLWPFYGQTARLGPGCPVAITSAENTTDDTSKEWLPFFGYITSISSDTIVCRSVKTVLSTMYWFPANAYIGPDGVVGNRDQWFRRPLYWWFNSTVPISDYLGNPIRGNPGSGWQIQSGKLGSMLPGLTNLAVNYPDLNTFASGSMEEETVRSFLQTAKPDTSGISTTLGQGSLAQVSFGSFLAMSPPYSTSGIDYLSPLRITYTASRTAEDKTFSLRYRIWPAVGLASSPYQGAYRILPTNSACGLKDPANYSSWGTTVSLDTSFTRYIEVEDSDVSLGGEEPPPGARVALGQSWVDWFTQTTRYSSTSNIGSAYYNSDGSIGINYLTVADDSSQDRYVLLHDFTATATSFSDMVPLTTKIGYYGRTLWNTDNYGLDQITYPTSSTPFATGGWDNLCMNPCIPEFDVGTYTSGTSNVTYDVSDNNPTGKAHTENNPDHQTQADLVNSIQGDNSKWRAESGTPYGGDSTHAQLVTQTVSRMSVTTSYSGYQFAFTQAGRALCVWAKKMALLLPNTDYIPPLEILQNSCDLLTGEGTLTLGTPMLYSGDGDWAPTYYRNFTKYLVNETGKDYEWKSYS